MQNTLPEDPDLLLDSEIETLSTAPLVGTLRLTTNSGEIALRVEKDAARFLLDYLVDFLSDEGEAEPVCSKPAALN